VVAVEIFIVLSLYIYVLFRVPELRLGGTIIAVAAIGGFAFYMFTVPPEPQEELNRIAFEEVTLEEMDLVLGPRIATLSGRAFNGSKNYTLTEIDFDVKLYDCPSEDSDFVDCFTIGEDGGYARFSAPPEQLRAFKATFLFNNLPDATGFQRWDYRITAVRALEIMPQ